MLKRATGVVIQITADRNSAQEIAVEIEGERGQAIAYPALVGRVEVGDEVVLNTTAVDLGLGTGGWHFVIENLSRRAPEVSGPGRIMKLRYTPHQLAVQSVEEDDSPYREAIERFKSLEKMPVVVGQLHSQIGPAAAAIKRGTTPKARTAYIMTDSAALETMRR